MQRIRAVSRLMKNGGETRWVRCWKVAADAIRTTRRLMKQKALSPYHPEELLPGPSVGDDDA